MPDKMVIVIDTNFIIEHIPDLRDVYQKLSETYDVFVSDISIQERLSQKYLELRAKYDKIEKFKKEHSYLAKIEIKHSFDKQYELDKEFTQNGYRELFKDNIIPLISDECMLKTIMERVFKKIPPFISADNASDKGLKDTMLWLSLLEHFKNHDCSNLIFITGDKGFRNNADALCKEFSEYTGKSIEINGNNFYDSYIDGQGINETKKENSSSPNVKFSDFALAREEVKTAITSLCFTECENNYGDTWLEKSFTLSHEVTADDMKSSFEKLRDIITVNLFETALQPNIAFPTISAINNKYAISTNELQTALALYEDIRNIHPEHISKFFSAAANIFNNNYEEPTFTDVDDDDLPF